MCDWKNMAEGNDLRKQKTGIEGKAILMFPGQGSQSIGMGTDFLNENKEYSEYFEMASDIFGEDILAVINNKNGSGELLDQTKYSQIAIYSLSCALNDYLFKQKGFDKSSVKTAVGHSLGDYSALYSCGAFNFRQGAELVSFRGKLMTDFADGRQSAGGIIPDGLNKIISENDEQPEVEYISGDAPSRVLKTNLPVPENIEDSPKKMMMAAVLGLDFETIKSVLKDFSRNVFIANYNDYSQIVISGMAEDVLKAGEELKVRGAKRIVPLKVSIASHCPLMKEVSLSLKDHISGRFQGFTDLGLKFFSSTELSYIDKDQIKETLANQLISPVRWVNAVEELLTGDLTVFIEVGPGKVLSGLTKRIASKLGREDIMIFSMDNLNDINNLKSYLGV
jgi:[acyl-carrier-protein] S-malonyltransferase